MVSHCGIVSVELEIWLHLSEDSLQHLTEKYADRTDISAHTPKRA